MRKLAIPLAIVCLSVVLMGAGSASRVPHGRPDGAAASSSLTIPSYDPSASHNPVVNVVGVLTGEAATPTPTPTPVESIAGETATPHLTPPPTSMVGAFTGQGGSGLMILLTCLTVALISFFVARNQRASIRG